MKIVVKNPEFNRPGIWFFEQPEFFEYNGEEVNVKWLKPSEIALSTGNAEFPFRIINKRNIAFIDDKPVETQQDSAVKTFVVKGSKGDEYVVTIGNGKYHCTCSGFQFRKTCKHITEKQHA
jgi:hypothetical protein